MAKRLPEHILPLRLARSGQSLAGRISVAKMPRLCDSLSETSTEVEVKLRFGINELGNAWVRGEVSAEFELVCQRCLETFVLPLELNIQLGLVTTDQEAEELDRGYDALVVAGEPVSLAHIVEDELLLALPTIPMHPRHECSNPHMKSAMDVPVLPSANPFAVLGELRSRKQ